MGGETTIPGMGLNYYHNGTTSGISVDHTHSIPAMTINSQSTSTSGSTGSGTSFSVQNPYVVVYMWKRTA